MYTIEIGCIEQRTRITAAMPTTSYHSILAMRLDVLERTRYMYTSYASICVHRAVHLVGLSEVAKERQNHWHLDWKHAKILYKCC